MPQPTVKLNSDELQALTGTTASAATGRAFLERFGLQGLLVTQGASGAQLLLAGGGPAAPGAGVAARISAWAPSAPAPSVTQNPQVAAYAALQQQQAFQEEMQRGLMQQQMMMNYAAQNPMMAAMMQQNPEVMRQFMALMQGQGAPPQQPP